MLNRAGSVPMKPVELQLKAKGEINYGHLAKWDVKIPTRSGWPGRGSSNCVPGCKPSFKAEGKAGRHRGNMRRAKALN